MSLARRIRLLVLVAIVAALVIFYVANGPEQTRNSEFYTRTVTLMEAKARGEHPAAQPHQQHQRREGDSDKAGHPDERAGHADRQGHSKAGTANKDDKRHANAEGKDKSQGESKRGHEGQQRLMDTDEDLRERLREAEKVAKKSADDKYRALQDIEFEVNREREVRLAEQEERDAAADPAGAKEKSVAGRKKLGADERHKPIPGSKDEDPEEARLRRVFVEILTQSPLTIFSKSYCPYSAKAKHILLQAYSILPPPHVVELDLHEDGRALQELLVKTTGRRTVPNVLIRGKSMGGGDETELLWKSGELPARIKQIGGKKVESIKMNFAWGEQGGRRDAAKVY